MSWHDNACDEPSADLDLRAELKSLLGLDPAAPVRPQADPTPEAVRLADELLREANRRRHAAVRSRPRVWPMLLAAGLPLALALGGLGTWGAVQKRRADSLAAAVRDKDAEMQRLAKDSAQATAMAQAAQSELVRVRTVARPGQKAKELVLPMAQSGTRAPLDTQTVSNPSR